MTLIPRFITHFYEPPRLYFGGPKAPPPTPPPPPIAPPPPVHRGDAAKPVADLMNVMRRRFGRRATIMGLDPSEVDSSPRNKTLLGQ